ncbi:hypothetical protein AJ79_01503 [Helicocarpus griseus UAMH5409]|uniref:Uncharacterized protein n=1 Tax=Helicocarpus griseus UAMH5409 TaxID=1447875 RepID=A0A2B7Y6Z1_9EURO|nr:hypothetical protein AJ79_01503 [Helicocarpus griseus UAMH5409]
MYSQQPLLPSLASSSRSLRESLPSNGPNNSQFNISSPSDKTMTNPHHTTNFNSMNYSKQPSPLSAMSNDILPRLHTSSSTLSQSSLTDPIDANLTPSTPLSGLSTRDYAPFAFSRSPGQVPANTKVHAHPRNGDFALQRSTDLTKAMVAKTPNGSPSRVNITSEFSQGQKRTASGEMKSAVSPAHFQSPKAVTATRRSRTMSTDSTGSRIAELSAQLRARLSYAASKVEKDWPVRTIEGTHASPPRFGDASTTQSSLPQGFKSPSRSPRGPKHLRARHSISSTPTTNGPSKPRSPEYSRNLPSMTPAIVPTFHNGTHSPNENARAYIPPPPTFTNNNPPRLAPPADIVSGIGNAARRRPNPNDVLLQNGFPSHNHHSRSQSFSNGNHSTSSTQITTSTVAIPDTPRPSQPQLSRQSATPGSATATMPVRKLRTPSQNALMEKDAIETLLFMSSPENSGYHPSSQNTQQTQQSDYSGAHLTLPPPSLPKPPSQQSSSIESRMGLGIGRENTYNPARPARKVSFADDTSNESNDAYFKNGYANSGLREHEAGDAIDRMLDELGDSDSESEGDWLTRFMSQNDRGNAMDSHGRS